MTNVKYYFILMSQKQMLENEVLEEILRERTSYYCSKNKKIDFWLLITPNFLKNFNLYEKIRKTNFYKQQEKNISFDFNNIFSNSDQNSLETLKKYNSKKKDFYSVIISSDKEFIKWLKLRVGYFEDIDNLNFISENYISDGIFGILNYEERNKISVLNSNKNFLHPEILLKKYKKALEISYINV
jgi:hypothetical protein